MHLTMAMVFAQADADKFATAGADPSLLMVIGIIALATLVALGLKFFINLFEILRYPTASLGHHGQHDTFFFSLMVVFLGGLIAAFVLFQQQPEIKTAFHDYADGTARAAATAGANPNYLDAAADWGARAMDYNFAIYFLDNLLYLPVFFVLGWIVLGAVAWFSTKLFGGAATMSNFLGTLAYGAFFFVVGFGLCVLPGCNGLAATAAMVPFTPDAQFIIGAILLLYGLVLWLIGLGQGANIATGQVIGAVVVLLIVLGGVGYGAYYMMSPKYEAFITQIQTYNPAK